MNDRRATPGEIAAALDRARRARPTLAVDSGGFAEHLQSRLGEAPPGTAIADLQVEDLLLAYACAKGDPAALHAFEAEIVASAPSFIRRLRLPAAALDEIQQTLRSKLLLRGADGSPPRILGYSGRGKLASWARVAAVRAGLDMRRGSGEGAAQDDDADLVSPATDLEVQHLRARFGHDFEQAIREAAAALEPKQRALLRMQHVDGLNGEQIAAVYGVNRSTVSRWLAAAHDVLLAGVRRLLMTRRGLSPSEFESLARLVMSDLEVSARVLLAGE